MNHPAFLFLGEALWLDLANTVPLPALHESRPDTLSTPEAVSDWLSAAGLPALDPRIAHGVLRELRAELIRLGDALAAGDRPPTSAVTAINALLRGSGGREQLTRVSGNWHLDFVPAAPPGALEALARSAALTLANPLALVRRCVDPACRRLLVDTSATHSRTWCRERCRMVAGIERRRGARSLTAV